MESLHTLISTVINHHLIGKPQTSRISVYVCVCVCLCMCVVEVSSY